MRQCNTIKLSDLIKNLQEIKAEVGDLPVAVAKDHEGNGFSTLSVNDFISDCTSVEKNGILVLWPWAELEDLDEINIAKPATFTIENPRADDLDEDYDDEPPYGCNLDDDYDEDE